MSNLSPEFPMETTYEVFISKIVCTQFLLLWSYAVKQSTDYWSNPRSYEHCWISSWIRPEKIQACMGFELVTSAILVQRSTNWANKPTGSWSLCWIQNIIEDCFYICFFSCIAHIQFSYIYIYIYIYIQSLVHRLFNDVQRVLALKGLNTSKSQNSLCW